MAFEMTLKTLFEMQFEITFKCSLEHYSYAICCVTFEITFVMHFEMPREMSP